MPQVKAITNEHLVLSMEPGTTILVHLPTGTEEGVLVTACRLPSDQNTIVAVVTVGGKTRTVEAGRIGPVVRTKGNNNGKA